MGREGLNGGPKIQGGRAGVCQGNEEDYGGAKEATKYAG